MFGIGTIINCLAILAGGLCGILFGKFVNSRLQDGLTKTCGVSVLFIGIAGALEKMLNIEGTSLTSQGTMPVVEEQIKVINHRLTDLEREGA